MLWGDLIHSSDIIFLLVLIGWIVEGLHFSSPSTSHVVVVVHMFVFFFLHFEASPKGHLDVPRGHSLDSVNFWVVNIL
jgi:hypothetical protein